MSGEKQPATSEANKIMTLAKFALDLWDQGLDWGPHTQLRGPNSLAVIEVLVSLHLPPPQGPLMQKQEDRPETWSGLAKELPVLCLSQPFPAQGSLAGQELAITKQQAWGFLTAGSSIPE